MSQTIITRAFEQYKAQREALALPVELNEFVLANVPNQDPDKPINREEIIPPAEQIVFVSDVTQDGYVNPNAVVYSLTMGTTVGDFEFNWIGLRNKETGIIAAISHLPLIAKTKTIIGTQDGNSITRSIMMSYCNAKAIAGIHVDASTWQIDFTARLMGMDEVERLANVDHYQSASFINSGFNVFKDGIDYKATAGVGYIGGLRCYLQNDLIIQGVTKPCFIYVDACWKGLLTSKWQTDINLVSSVDELAGYVGDDGYLHFVTKIAQISLSGEITDLRLLGGMAALERKDNYATDADIDSVSTANKHLKLSQFWRGISKKITEAFNLFKQTKINTTGALKGGGDLSANRTLSVDSATTAQKGVSQLSDSVSSTSSVLSATAKAVKTAYDKANHSHPYLGVNSKAVDSDKLDGHDSSYFALASQVLTNVPLGAKFTDTNTQRAISDSVTSTSQIVSASLRAVKTAYDKAVSAYNLAASKMTQATADGRYLGKTAKAADSDKLDGHDTSYFARANQVLTNVPAGAKFTDTNTQRAISSSLSSTSTTTSASSSAVKQLANWLQNTTDIADDAFSEAQCAIDIANEALKSIGFLKSANGYMKLSNGMIVQWGRSSGTGTAIFPVAFPVACAAVLSELYGQTSYHGGMGVYNVSNTRFSQTCGNSGSTNWIAIGY